MIFKIEIECPYCDKIHVHRLDVGVSDVTEEYPNLLQDYLALKEENKMLLMQEPEEEKHNDECGPEES